MLCTEPCLALPCLAKVELIARCPLSCHACIANPGDDPNFADSQGFGCADWTGTDCGDDLAVQALGA